MKAVRSLGSCGSLIFLCTMSVYTICRRNCGVHDIHLYMHVHCMYMYMYVIQRELSHHEVFGIIRVHVHTVVVT